MDPLRTTVGYGEADITPPPGTAMSGFAARTGPAMGVHDRLQAKAVCFSQGGDRAILVALDVIGVDAALTAEVRERLRESHGLPPERVVLVATHTHGGPAVLRGAFLGDVEDGSRALLVDGAVAAAERALDDLALASLGFAQTVVEGIAKNRRVPDGVTDPRVSVLVARRQLANDVALIGFACHPVVLGADNRLFTRDYPGFLVDSASRLLGGAHVAFVGGCSGQINNGHRAEESFTAAASPIRTFEEARRIGELLGEAAAEAASYAAELKPLRDEQPLDAAATTVALPYSAPPTGPLSDPGHEGLRAAQAAWAARFPLAEAGEREVEVTCWRLGDLMIAFFPGEVFVEQGLELEAELGGRALCLSNANDAPGYVPHPTAFAAGGYEVAEAFRYYGAPGPFTPEASVRLGAAMAGLARRMVPDLSP